MPIYSDKFKGLHGQPTSDDLTDLVLAIIDNVMRNLHVASLAIVTKINSGTSVNVKLFPTNENETEKEIEVANVCGLVLQPSDKVVILYIDKDFRQNLSQIMNNQENKLSKNQNKERHNEKFGIVINKIVF